ncbi:hypothetical protein M407DRAFT_24088 [Tulasnella calospora MUT 4182]|uniref:F-box domain-containing protein n=1 Tax=Tulasnella calospora MUT 4182 TaxID=1051891 RepID=A0A0C3QK18_9AGAM|nr:hypothetical protein M407DRAFT_24088 [Tulasnella calospora MUT 4182]
MSQTLRQGSGDSGPDEYQIVNLKALVSPPSSPSDDDPPIHHLPTEILLEVVRYYSHRDARIRDLVRLALVCGRWSILVQDATVLWTTINAAEGPAMVRKALQMAKDASVDLTFNAKTAQMKRKVFFNCIGERVGQWRTLVLLIQWSVRDFILGDGDLQSVAPTEPGGASLIC